ncbi:MAG: class I SAM-dependent methyltransferase [Magnetococcales bacterium]|nr:class I SAM-dependent methyltransferase [Magnetococcales bacterium]
MKIQAKRGRRWLQWLRATFFHPAWLTNGVKRAPIPWLRCQVRGRVLDIGAADGLWRRYLSRDVSYLTLDYYQTAHDWYGTRPDVYGTAEQLPFSLEQFDWVLLLNVMEHLPHPQSCVCEILRVLKPGGRLLLQIPFLYPLHDVPLDFQRFTPYGLEVLAQENGFVVESTQTLGHSVETAGLLLNIALSRCFLDLGIRRHPLFLLVPLVPVVVVMINLAVWCAAKILPSHPMICQGLLAVWKKP